MPDLGESARRTVYVARRIPAGPFGAVLLVLAIAVAGGASIGAAIGARRANHGVADFVRYYEPEDAGAFAQTSPDKAGAALAAVGRIPGVAAYQRKSIVVMGFRLPGGQFRAGVTYVDLDAPQPGLLRPYVLSGRLPDPARTYEVAINRFTAHRLRIGVGGRIKASLFSADQIDNVGAGRRATPKLGSIELTVTGIVRRPQDLETNPVTDAALFDFDDAYVSLTPAFWRARGEMLASYGVVSFLRVHGSPNALASMVHKAKIPVGIIPADQTFKDRQSVDRSVHIESASLWLIAALVAVVAAVLVGPALRRWAAITPTDENALRAVGVTRAGLVAVELARAVPVVVLGAVVAVPLGAVFGTHAAFGTSKTALIDHSIGWPVDVLAVGFGAILVLGTAVVVLPRVFGRSTPVAGRRGEAEGSRGFGSLLGRLAASGAPPSVLAGARLAVPSGDGVGTAIRSAVVTVTLGVALVVSSITFGASMSRLVSSPHLRGWNWDYEVGNFSEPGSVTAASRKLRADRDVAAFTGWNTATQSVGGQRLDAAGIRDPAVALLPVFSGRLPRRAGEVALTRRSLTDLHRKIGDRLAIQGNTKRMFTIVGTTLGPGALSPEEELGSGSVMTFTDLQKLQPDLVAGTFLVRFRPDVDPAQAAERLRWIFPRTVVGPFPTLEITTVRRAGPLTQLLAAMVTVLALGTLVYAIATALRRRRHEIAVLKSLGFERNQLRIATIVQASLLALVALVIGLPLGLVLGRGAWVLAAQTIGVVVAPVVSVPTILLIIVVAMAAALVVGALSSRQVTRVPAATTLRPE